MNPSVKLVKWLGLYSLQKTISHSLTLSSLYRMWLFEEGEKNEERIMSPVVIIHGASVCLSTCYTETLLSNLLGSSDQHLIDVFCGSSVVWATLGGPPVDWHKHAPHIHKQRQTHKYNSNVGLRIVLKEWANCQKHLCNGGVEFVCVWIKLPESLWLRGRGGG